MYRVLFNVLWRKGRRQLGREKGRKVGREGEKKTRGRKKDWKETDRTVK